jgi:hypothetical protein
MSGEALHENSGSVVIDNSFDFHQKGQRLRKSGRVGEAVRDQTVLIIEHWLG